MIFAKMSREIRKFERDFLLLPHVFLHALDIPRFRVYTLYKYTKFTCIAA